MDSSPDFISSVKALPSRLQNSNVEPLGMWVTLAISTLAVSAIYWYIPWFGLTNDGHCDGWWYFGLAIDPTLDRYVGTYHGSRVPTFFLQNALMHFIPPNYYNLVHAICYVIPWMPITIYFGSRTMSRGSLAIIVCLSLASTLSLSIGSTSYNNLIIPMSVSAHCMGLYSIRSNRWPIPVAFGFLAATVIFGHFVAILIMLPSLALVIFSGKKYWQVPAGAILAAGFWQCVNNSLLGRSGFFVWPTLEYFGSNLSKVGPSNPWFAVTLTTISHSAVLALLTISFAVLAKHNSNAADRKMLFFYSLSAIGFFSAGIANGVFSTYDYYYVFLLLPLAASAALVYRGAWLVLVALPFFILALWSRDVYPLDKLGSSARLWALGAILIATATISIAAFWRRTPSLALSICHVVLAAIAVNAISGKSYGDGFWWVDPAVAKLDYADTITTIHRVKSDQLNKTGQWSNGKDPAPQFYTMRAMGACAIVHDFPNKPDFSVLMQPSVETANSIILYDSKRDGSVDTAAERLPEFHLVDRFTVPSKRFDVLMFSRK